MIVIVKNTDVINLTKQLDKYATQPFESVVYSTCLDERNTMLVTVIPCKTWAKRYCRKKKHFRKNRLFYQFFFYFSLSAKPLTKLNLMASSDVTFEVILKVTKVILSLFVTLFWTPATGCVSLRGTGAELKGSVQPPHQALEIQEPLRGSGLSTLISTFLLFFPRRIAQRNRIWLASIQ